MKKCPFCAEDIQDEAIKCPHCGSDLSPFGAPGTPIVAAGTGSNPPPAAAAPATQFSHTGARYVLGYGPDFYGIWDRESPATPVQSFPRDEGGWRDAWLRYSALEPNNQPVGPFVATGMPPSRPASRTNGMAIASLVLGIVGFIYAVPAILALVFGYTAKDQIDRSGGGQEGRGMAIAGITLGWVWIGLFILGIILSRYVVLAIEANQA